MDCLRCPPGTLTWHQRTQVQDGEWWKSNGNGAAGASLKQGPAWWGHGKAEDTWQSGLSAVWSRKQALKAAKARKGNSSL